MYRSLIYILLVVMLLGAVVRAAKVFDNKNLSTFKIISAEKLDYKDGDSTLIGNVKVQLGDYTLSSPKVFIDADEAGKPLKARFIESVLLESKNMVIEAPLMEIDVKASVFKCLSNEKKYIVTKFLAQKGQKESILYSWYQEMDLNSGIAKAIAQRVSDSKNKILEKIIFINDDLEISSDNVEMSVQNNVVSYVNFFGDVISKDDHQRTQSQELYYFPATEIIKAETDVSVAYLDKVPTYIFSDTLIYEKNKHIISAFSRSQEAKTEIHRQNAFGRARQVILHLDKTNQADNAVLTGNAFAQYQDKSVSGHEVLFDIKKRNLETVVGRPKTSIFKAEEKL